MSCAFQMEDAVPLALLRALLFGAICAGSFFSYPVVAQDITDWQTARQVLIGTWRGSYFCGQGETALDLGLDSVQNDSTVTGTFKFHNLPNRTNAKAGEYQLLGNYNLAQRTLIMRPEAWIAQPSGYTGVGFTAVFSAQGPVLVGRIDFAGCSAMKVAKGEGARSLPPGDSQR